MRISPWRLACALAPLALISVLHVRFDTRDSSLPIIYAITPTYTRLTQKADLTQMANTLRQVPSLNWMVVEDSANKTRLVRQFLRNSGIMYTHLNIPTPAWCRAPCLARGTEQRNKALDWLRQHRTYEDSGVVFFADDDNTYSLELFDEMRYTKWVSMWPVGFAGERLYEGPRVENNTVVGWYTSHVNGRKFPVDMAGFGVNLHIILANPRARFRLKDIHKGWQETDFLTNITTIEDLEPKASNCTRVLVWHTRTEKPRLKDTRKTGVEV